MSSTTVTKRSEKRKTPTTTTATIGQRIPPDWGSAESVGPADAGGSGGWGGSNASANCCVTTPSEGSALLPSSGAAAALVVTSSVTAEGSPGVDSVTPAVVVPPSRRSNELSGTRTTTCLTALFVRSIDWTTRAVPVVAAMEPMATPTMVPLTPKMDAMTADNTAPAAEARICR
jgi:hypothetical protein